MFARNIARFAFKIGAEHDGFVACLLRSFGGGNERVRGLCYDRKARILKRGIAGLRQFIFRIVECRQRSMQAA